MTNYAVIIAKTNVNGELEFWAYTKSLPEIPINIAHSNTGYQEMYKSWEQSAQVFKAPNRYEQDKIIMACTDLSEWKDIGINENFKRGVDVTEFVKILARDYWIAGENHFAFLKSPSKEETKFCMAASERSLAKDWEKEDPLYCQTCGGEVKVHGSKDGTHYFEPVTEPEESYDFSDIERAYVIGLLNRMLSIDELLAELPKVKDKMPALKEFLKSITRLPKA